VRSPAIKVLMLDTETGHIGNKRFDEKFSGRRVQRHSTIAFASHTKCRSVLLTLVAIHEIVWGENDAVRILDKHFP
jgi:hypothetical protein